MMGASIGAMILYGAILLGNFAVLVLQTTGNGFCMAIPDKPGTGRKPLAIATFACIVAIIAFDLLTCGAMFVFRGRGHFVGIVPLLVSIGYFFCYCLFLRAVAVAMREHGVARQILIFMITVPCLVVVLPVLFCVMAMIGGLATLGVVSQSNSPQGAAGGFGAMVILGLVCDILFLCIWVGMYIWYVVLVHQARNAVRDYVH
jgi:hypothetical protein